MFHFALGIASKQESCAAIRDFQDDGCVVGVTSIIHTKNVNGSTPYDEIYNKHNRSYFEALEVKAEKMAKKYDCAFVDNEMPYGRVPQGHPVIVDYFYHEEIRGTENTGKRNR